MSQREGHVVLACQDLHANTTYKEGCKQGSVFYYINVKRQCISKCVKAPDNIVIFVQTLEEPMSCKPLNYLDDRKTLQRRHHTLDKCMHRMHFTDFTQLIT